MDRKGQRVSTPDGKGEVTEAVAGEVKVKFDSGEVTTLVMMFTMTLRDIN